jgi:hypothetical protein
MSSRNLVAATLLAVVVAPLGAASAATPDTHRAAATDGVQE